jgi:hypothetical protein
VIAKYFDMQELSAREALRFIHYAGEVGEPKSHAGISFSRVSDSGFESLGAIVAHDLDSKWDQLARYIGRDSYFSINSVFPSWNAAPSEVTGLPKWRRTVESLRWLNCLWVDLDDHSDTPISFEEMLSRFEHARTQLALPVPGLLASSGRGLWALWRLRSYSNSTEPVRAVSEKLTLWRRIEDALVERFGADPKSRDAAHIMRIPGTHNSKAPIERSRAVFWKIGEDRHTLVEMAGLLGVRAAKTAVTVAEHERAEKNPARQAAGRRRWEQAWAGFVRLLELRHGRMPIGTRRTAIAVAAFLLARMRRDRQMIDSTCFQFAADWQLHMHEVPKRIGYGIKKARSFTKVSTRQLCNLLQVTADERDQIPEWQHRPRRVSRTSRDEVTDQVKQRRTMLKLELSLNSKASSRRLAARFKVDHATILRDRRALASSSSLTGTSAPVWQNVPAPASKLNAEQRRAILWEWSGQKMTTGQMRDRLTREYAVTVSRKTIHRDLKETESNAIEAIISEHYIKMPDGELVRRRVVRRGEGSNDGGATKIRVA